MTYEPQHGNQPPSQPPPWPPMQPTPAGGSYLNHPLTVQAAPQRRWGAGKITALVVGIVGVLCLAGGCVSILAAAGGDDTGAKILTPTAVPTGTPARKPADDGGKSGVFNVPAGTTLTITDGDESGTVQNVTVSRFRTQKGACAQYMPDADQGSYLIADVLVIQKSGTGSVNPLFFTYVGADGTTANAASGAFSGCAESALGSTNSLRAGTRRSGQIVFDVASADGVIEFAPGLGGEAVGSWRVG